MTFKVAIQRHNSTRSGGPRTFPAWVILAAAALTFAFTMGVRNTMGLYLPSLNASTGLGMADISLAFACGQLWWGITQPFAGAIADRIGAGRVILTGIILMITGTVLTPMMTSTTGLIICLGVLAAGGAGMAGPSVLMSAGVRNVSPQRRGWATGIINAGGSAGQLTIAPVATGLTAYIGWAHSMQWLGLIVLLALPAAWLLKGHAASTKEATPDASEKISQTGRSALILALSTPGYCFLALGFMICGFHIAFLATHLPGMVESCGMPSAIAGWSLAVIGLFNIIGSLSIGWAIGHWRMKSLLSLLYTIRGLAILIFLLSPKSPAIMLLFSAIMGVTFLSTVPPTAGLVAKMFGPANMAMLFGVLMFVHQIGGFLGAYIGGQVFQSTGSYDGVWYIDIGLAAGAAIIHFLIREDHNTDRSTAERDGLNVDERSSTKASI